MNLERRAWYEKVGAIRGRRNIDFRTMALIRESPWWSDAVGFAVVNSLAPDPLPVGTFEEYKVKYAEKRKVHPTSWPEQSMDRLWHDWQRDKSYSETFCGCCRPGERVELIRIPESNMLVFSRDWGGDVRDHSDIGLWLRRTTRRFGLGPEEWTCEVYSYGTIRLRAGDAFHSGDVRARDPARIVDVSRVSNFVGIYDVRLEPPRLHLERITGWGSGGVVLQMEHSRLRDTYRRKLNAHRD